MLTRKPATFASTSVASASASSPPPRIVNTPVLQRIANGEAGAFEDFMEQYRSLLVYLIRMSVGVGPRARSEIDDALQDVCLAIWQAAARFDPAKGSERTFIAMLARRRVIDRYYRRRSRITTIEFASEAVEEYACIDIDGRDSSPLPEHIESALERLEPENRHLLEQAVVHGRSSTQIARATGLGVNTVKTRIHRALNRVRSCAAAEVARAAA